MNILIVSHRVPFPPKDGGALAIYHTAKALAEQGNNIYFYALNAQKHGIKSKDAEAGMPFLKECYFHNFNSNFNLMAALKALISAQSYNLSRFHLTDFEEIVKNKIKNSSFDAILIESVFAAHSIKNINFNTANFILRQHNAEYEIWQRKAFEETNFLRKIYYKILAKQLKKEETALVKRFKKVVYLSQLDQDKFINKDQLTTVIPAGLQNNEKVLAPNFNNIYHLGALDWEPNLKAVQWLIDEIWPLVISENPNLKLFIAGRNMPEKMKKSKHQGVEFLGEIEDAKQFIENKGICLVPLKSGSGLRIKIIEAMLSNKLVISTKVGASGIEAVSEKDIIIRESAQNLAEAILLASKEPQRMLKIVQSCKNFALNNFEIKNVTKKLFDFMLAEN